MVLEDHQTIPKFVRHLVCKVSQCWLISLFLLWRSTVPHESGKKLEQSLLRIQKRNKTSGQVLPGLHLIRSTTDSVSYLYIFSPYYPLLFTLTLRNTVKTYYDLNQQTSFHLYVNNLLLSCALTAPYMSSISKYKHNFIIVYYYTLFDIYINCCANLYRICNV